MRDLLPHVPVLAASFGDWKFTGGITTIDLIAASTNALNGALLARRPDHYKSFTVVGILLMAILGGIGGGVTRDVILNKIPSAFTKPAYLTLCIVFGIVGYLLAYGKGQLFREGLFQFATAFSLPWFTRVRTGPSRIRSTTRPKPRTRRRRVRRPVHPRPHRPPTRRVRWNGSRSYMRRVR